MPPQKLQEVLSQEPVPSLSEAIERAQDFLLSHQKAEGYWWYTLEANETIGSGSIQVSHFLGCVDSDREKALLAHLITQQRSDGSWALYYGGPGDLSITVEAYLALRLGGHSPEEEVLRKARSFIIDNGGLAKIRVFTRIHLALFGLVPWETCTAMPVWLIFLPVWTHFSIYEFSSWARASIVPLLIVLDKRPVRPVSFDLRELSTHPLSARDWKFETDKGFLSWGRFFIAVDKALKLAARLPWHPGKKQAHVACERWIREHLERTEDIYPALAYGALALAALGYPSKDPHIQKALKALRSFQQPYSEMFPSTCEVPGGGRPVASFGEAKIGSADDRPLEGDLSPSKTHQQCCISPLWDTPWAVTALLRSGESPDDPSLQKAARYLLSKQIMDFKGDWALKNPEAQPGGWAFEFENDYFPDIDDTIQILEVLKKIELPKEEKEEAIGRGLDWLLSMQSKNGGWAAFDKDNRADWVNRIPFSDHGACLDPPTPDVTGRMIGMLARFGYKKDHPVIQRALRFINEEQRSGDHSSLGRRVAGGIPLADRSASGGRAPDKGMSSRQDPAQTATFGAWWGRWGVNYIYGTWCVLEGLAAIGFDRNDPMIRRAVEWLKAVQCEDGGWGESCAGYREDCFVSLNYGVPSQTAWALLGLMAAGEGKSESVERGIEFLKREQRVDGGWDEEEFTGTGFPGHFFIRYHGYRHYFPLLALGNYAAETK